MKPPTFIECSVCGREFGSKSIQIHEPQCLQKLRRTEIPTTETHPSKPRRKKKLSPPLSNSGNPQETNSAPLPSTTLQHPFGSVTMDSRKINLPKISTHRERHSKVSSEPSSRTLTRPSTATLAKPKILNIDYIQYDMSLTRIDFSSSSHSPSPVPSQNNIMDENHNHKTTHRLTRQNTSVIDPAHRSPFMLPAVSPTSNSRSVLPTKLYKGVDVGLTKLPPSSITSINSILGDPLKRTNGAGGTLQGFGNDFYPRQSGKLSIKTDATTFLPCRDFVPLSSTSCWSSGIILIQSSKSFMNYPDLPYYIPADEFPIESPFSCVSPGCSVTNSLSLPYLHSISSSQCLIKNNDTHLLDKIPEITRRSERQPTQDFSTVTSAFAAVNDETNDSKVQDQSQAQRKCCGGQGAACKCQYDYTPTKKSVQSDHQEMFKIEGASFPKEEHFFQHLEKRSSQEIVFLKETQGFPHWTSEMNVPCEAFGNSQKQQEEFKQIFVGAVRSSDSFETFSSGLLPVIKRVIKKENTVYNNISSADEESLPPSRHYYYEDDFEEQQTSLDENFVYNEGYCTEQSSKEVAVIDIDEDKTTVVPLMKMIDQITKDIPPLCSKVHTPVIVQPNNHEPKVESESCINVSSSIHRLPSNMQQGSGSEGDDEGSCTEAEVPVKWKSSWSLVDKKPEIKSVGLSKTRDSVQRLKEHKERNIKEGSCSGRKQWKKPSLVEFNIGQGFNDMIVKETSIACEINPLKSGKEKVSIHKNYPYEKIEIKHTPKLRKEFFQDLLDDVSIWEGCTCDLSLILNPDETPTRNPQSVPPSQKHQTKSNQKTKGKSVPRPNSRQNTSQKQKFVPPSPPNSLTKERAISDLVSAVFRLQKLKEDKFERPKTQGYAEHYDLDPKYLPEERFQERARTAPDLHYNYGSLSGKPKQKTTRGAFTCSKEAKEIYVNSVKEVNAREELKMASRPGTPMIPRTAKESTMSRIDQIAKIYGAKVKPVSAAIATQTPRKGERLLTPTKDRKSTAAKTAIATQTTSPPTKLKSAMKKHTNGEKFTTTSKKSATPHTSRTTKSAVSPYLPSKEQRHLEKKKIQAETSENKKPREKVTVYRKTSCDHNRQSHNGSSKKRCVKEKIVYNPTQFYSETPSVMNIHEKSRFAESDNIHDIEGCEAELNHYEGCRKMNEISHELSVVTDDEIDICYRIFPSATSKEKVPSLELESSRSETVVNLSARRVKSKDSHNSTLKKKSRSREISRDNDDEINKQTKPKKSYSNIELMVPIPFDVSDIEAKSDFIDLNIVVRRKSGNGSYPSLDETKCGKDDKMLLILDETDEEKKIVETTSIQNLKTYVGNDLASATAIAEGIPLHKQIERQTYKLYGQEITTSEVPVKGSIDNKNSEIFNVDKLLKILFKRVSTMDTCEKISSAAIVENRNEKHCHSRSDSDKLNDIRKTINSKGLKASEEDLLQLLSSHRFLNEFLNDFVPHEDQTLDNLVKGIVATLTFFGLLPENNRWQNFCKNEKDR